uniref:Uncharacterized protein n=1 Tax=Anguilla anguilla TaxID=7936 RepID=A0A0E9S2Z7_ANGAN
MNPNTGCLLPLLWLAPTSTCGRGHGYCPQKMPPPSGPPRHA